MNTTNMEYSVCHLLLKNERERGEEIYLRQPYEGHWYELTWKEVMQKARQVAAFLSEKGLKRGDHVAIISKNCAEWFIADYGIALAGMVNIPLFSNQNQENIEYILHHGEVKLVFVGKLDNPQQIRRYIPDSYKTVSFGYHEDLSVDYQWRDILASEPLKDIIPPQPDDLYTIIYSSGTSATPKGAMYTHQLVANYLALYCEDIKRISDVEHYRLLSYLPLAHVYERSAIQLGSLTISCTVSFVESLEKFADNLREVQPTLFTAVPRIWGVFKHKIEQKIPAKKLNILLKIPLLSSLIKKKIRSQLGLKECTNCFSGASHLPTEIADFFEKLDIIIQEGYGQTENMAYATFSELENNRKGYVGSPRLGVEIKLGEEKELLMRSDCLMKGYFKDEEKSKETFTEDWWLKTGDIVEIDEKNRVKILGRLSEVFKNQKGEFINPVPIEKAFGASDFIEHLCLVGKELPHNIMLVNLSEEGKKADKEDVKESFKKRMRSVNSKLRSYEKISHVLVISDEWSIDNNFLTPTLKVKRRTVESEYDEAIKNTVKENHKAVVWH